MILHTVPTLILATILFNILLASMAFSKNFIISRYEKIQHTSLLINHLQDSKSANPSIQLYNMGIENLNFPGKALNFFLQAAELGLAEAQFNVAVLLSEKNSITYNKLEAKNWYNLAARQNFSPAQFNLALFLEKSDSQEDRHAAIKWFKQSADAGYAPSQINLGVLYATGTIIEENINAAINWFLKAKNTNFTQVLFNLGVAYEKLADENDNSNIYNVDHIEQKQFIQPIYQSHSFKWYKRAAKKGHVESILSVGAMYSSGFGTEKNLQDAFVWVSIFSGIQCNRNRLACTFNKTLHKGPVKLAYKSIYNLRIKIERQLKPDQIKEAQYLAAKLAYENKKIQRLLN